MWDNVVSSTSWGLVWLFCVTLLFFVIASAHVRWLKPFSAISIPLLIASIVRLVPMILLPVGAGYDIDSFVLVGNAFLAGEEVYTSDAVWRHPYLPMQMVAIGGAMWVSRLTAVPFVVWVKLPAVLADLAIVWFIYRVVFQWHEERETAVKWALLYALNPIPILVSAYHGQFDAIPLLFLLLSWWQLEQEQWPQSAIFLGLGILNKTWPVFFFPVAVWRVRGFSRQLAYSIICFAIPTIATVTYIIIYDADPAPMLGRALTHVGNPGYWGITAIIYAAVQFGLESLQAAYDFLWTWNRYIMLTIAALAWFISRKQHALNGLLTVMLGIFAVTAGIGVQWMLWLVPLGLLSGEHRLFKWFTVAGGLFLIVQLYGLHMYPWLNRLFSPEVGDLIFRLGSIPAWVVTVWWLARRLLGHIQPTLGQVDA